MFTLSTIIKRQWHAFLSRLVIALEKQKLNWVKLIRWGMWIHINTGREGKNRKTKDKKTGRHSTATQERKAWSDAPWSTIAKRCRLCLCLANSWRLGKAKLPFNNKRWKERDGENREVAGEWGEERERKGDEFSYLILTGLQQTDRPVQTILKEGKCSPPPAGDCCLHNHRWPGRAKKGLLSEVGGKRGCTGNRNDSRSKCANSLPGRKQSWHKGKGNRQQPDRDEKH